MDTSFGQAPTAEDLRQLSKLRADTPGPQTYYRAYHQSHNTTDNDASNHAFMHSGFPRKPNLPPLPDKSPRPRAPTMLPTKVAPPVSDAPTWDRASDNSTPGYIGPGQTSARAFPRETAEIFAEPEPSISDLAMVVAGAYPRPPTPPSYYDPRGLLRPATCFPGALQRMKRQADGGERRGFSGGEADVRGYDSQVRKRDVTVYDAQGGKLDVTGHDSQVTTETVHELGKGKVNLNKSPGFVEQWLSKIPSIPK
ncbi:hypothetical protein MMC30_004697 [Trapelia coarctata]|nr:hypothetical protein [Trapelia coarctata]